jgi:hypothetical protein
MGFLSQGEAPKAVRFAARNGDIRVLEAAERQVPRYARPRVVLPVPMAAAAAAAPPYAGPRSAANGMTAAQDVRDCPYNIPTWLRRAPQSTIPYFRSAVTAAALAKADSPPRTELSGYRYRTRI